MADSTVNQTVRHFGHDDAVAALEQVARATAILRVLSIAVDAQQDGAAVFDDNGVARWSPAVAAACACVRSVRDPLNETVDSPNNIDWWTPLTILEGMDAALWHTGIDSDAGKLSEDEFKMAAQVAMESLAKMRQGLAQAADELTQINAA